MLLCPLNEHGLPTVCVGWNDTDWREKRRERESVYVCVCESERERQSMFGEQKKFYFSKYVSDKIPFGSYQVLIS